MNNHVKDLKNTIMISDNVLKFINQYGNAK